MPFFSQLLDFLKKPHSSDCHIYFYSLAYCLGSSVNGLEEPSLAKRLRGTPERIELENYRLSLQREEELEEVPEETLAEHNLSSVLDKGTEEDVPSRLAHTVHKLFLCPSQQTFACFSLCLF